MQPVRYNYSCSRNQRFFHQLVAVCWPCIRICPADAGQATTSAWALGDAPAESAPLIVGGSDQGCYTAEPWAFCWWHIGMVRRFAATHSYACAGCHCCWWLFCLARHGQVSLVRTFAVPALRPRRFDSAVCVTGMCCKIKISEK